MDTGDNIFLKVREIIADELCVDIEQLKPETRFAEDLGADSIDKVDVILHLECEFEVQSTDDDMEAVATVADCVALVRRLVEA